MFGCYIIASKKKDTDNPNNISKRRVKDLKDLKDMLKTYLRCHSLEILFNTNFTSGNILQFKEIYKSDESVFLSEIISFSEKVLFHTLENALTDYMSAIIRRKLLGGRCLSPSRFSIRVW